ncbi:hypothetical protein HY837_00820 [archaeon]|nr:hypothetical protein [archaeon]
MTGQIKFTGGVDHIGTLHEKVEGTFAFEGDVFGLNALASKVADLAKLVAESRGERPVQTHSIQCGGASNKSKPVNAFVEVSIFPNSGDRDGVVGLSSGQSYVMCPRLQSFFTGHGYTTVCCEAEKPFDYQITGPERIKETERVLADSRPCPYFRLAPRQ